MYRTPFTWIREPRVPPQLEELLADDGRDGLHAPALLPRDNRVARGGRSFSLRASRDALSPSEKTVKAHVSHVLTKLELKDRTQLAIYAIKHGLAGEDEGR